MNIAIIYVDINMMNIKSVMLKDKPRERIFTHGAAALADYELIALLLGFGGKGHSVFEISQKLLADFGGLKGISQANSTQLLNIKYIGKSKAAILLALNELSSRIVTESGIKPGIQINSPQQVFMLLRSLTYLKKRECLFLLSLDTHNKLIEKDLISVGTITETLISPREVFRQALLRNAVSIVLAHNHPSNTSEPSKQDIVLTEKIALMGTQLGISLIDHVIICDHDYCSIKALNLFTSKLEGGEKNEKNKS